MKKDKKLLMMFIYYVSFMFNFFMTYKFFMAKDGTWLNTTIGSKIIIYTVNSMYVKKFYIFFGILCILSAIGIIYWTITYNMDVISEENFSVKKEIHEAWSKELKK